MNFYPFTAPIILTDAIFIQYGGHTGTSVAAQRQAAYFIAEKIASDDINTYFTPTIVTGTFIFNPLQSIILEQGYINRLIETRFIDKEEVTYLTVTGIDNHYVGLADDERGKVVLYNWDYSFYNPDLYKVQVVYETGLPSGTSYQMDILLGLTTYADLILNEIQGYGNESPGDIGVQSFKTIDYSETRIGLIRTNFGSSARAQFVYKLFTSFRKRRWVGL